MSFNPYQEFVLGCPDGGKFYICEGNTTEFIGCCTSNPCADGTGDCPTKNLRYSTFAEDQYSRIPQQSCDYEGKDIWYTCKATEPPFMGCCAMKDDKTPCGEGDCPQENLVPAVLNKHKASRSPFVTSSTTSFVSSESEHSSTVVRSITSTGADDILSDAPEPQEPDNSSGPNMPVGAIAGAAIGSFAAAILLVGLIWFCWWQTRKTRDRHEAPAPQTAATVSHQRPPDIMPEMACVGMKDTQNPNRASHISRVTGTTAAPSTHMSWSPTLGYFSSPNGTQGTFHPQEPDDSHHYASYPPRASYSPQHMRQYCYLAGPTRETHELGQRAELDSQPARASGSPPHSAT